MLVAHRYEEPAALPPIAGLPDEVGDLCRRCLDKDPGRRPSAAEVAELLGAVAGLAPATLLLPAVAPPDAAAAAASASALSAATRTALESTGVVADSTDAGPAPATGGRRRWTLPRSRRTVVTAGGIALLLGGAVVAILSGEPSGREAWVGVPATAAPPSERAGCSVDYTVARAADGRFATEVRIVNTATVPFPAGRLTFTLPGEQRLVAGTPGTWRQQGRTVSAQIGDLPAGRSRTATIRGTYRKVTALPDRFELNDTACRAILSVAGGSTAPTAPPEAGTPEAGTPAEAPRRAEEGRGGPGPGKAGPDGKEGKEGKKSKPEVKKPKK
jgi:serine/threonine-protein kinase